MPPRRSVGAWLARGLNRRWQLTRCCSLAAHRWSALVAGPLIERGLLRFMYGKDEVVLVLVTYAVFLILEDVIKLIWGVEPYSVVRALRRCSATSTSAACRTRSYNLLLVVRRDPGRRRAHAGAQRARASGKLLLAVIHDREMSAAMGINVEPRLPRHLHARHDARGARRRAHRADDLGACRRSGVEVIVLAFAVVVIGGLGSLPRRGARRGDRRPGALGRGALLARGRAVQHLRRDGAGADRAAARACSARPRRARYEGRPA